MRNPLVASILLALLCLAPSAQALTPPGDPSLPSVLAAPDDEAEESEAAASEDEEIEAEEECEEEEPGECEEEETGGAEAPAECLVTFVQPTVFASESRERVQLQIRYATAAPTPVAIDYGLHGHKGSLFLGNEKKRFGKKGVLRLDRKLTEAQMTKVLAARDFSVRLRVLAAPRWCQSYFDRQLDVRRATPHGLTWLQRE